MRGRLGCLKVGMFWKKKASMDGTKVVFPTLSARGHQIKVLMPALLASWEKHANVHNGVHAQVRAALQCTVHLDHILDEHANADVLPPDAAAEFKEAGFTLNSLMNALQLVHRPDGLSLFKIVPKNHYLAHICLAAAWINPRRAWCYAGEDMMRHVRRMAAACSRGRTPEKTGVAMMQYYMHALSMSICKRQDWWCH